MVLGRGMGSPIEDENDLPWTGRAMIWLFFLLFLSMKIVIHVEFCLCGDGLNPDDLTKRLVIGCLAPQHGKSLT